MNKPVWRVGELDQVQRSSLADTLARSAVGLRPKGGRLVLFASAATFGTIQSLSGARPSAPFEVVPA